VVVVRLRRRKIEDLHRTAIEKFACSANRERPASQPASQPRQPSLQRQPLTSSLLPLLCFASLPSLIDNLNPHYLSLLFLFLQKISILIAGFNYEFSSVQYPSCLAPGNVER
jgi:hypothetical protein